MSRIAVVAALLVVGCSASMSMAYADPTPSPQPPAPHGEGPLPGPPPGPAGDEAPPASPKTSFGDGTYTVGIDILPGVYESAGPIEGGTCYWKRANADGILANSMSKKPQTVQIEPGDTIFKTSKCQEWQKTDAAPPPQPGPGEVLSQLGPLIGGRAAAGGG